MRRAARRTVTGSSWPDLTDRPHLLGAAAVRRVGWWSYPVTELVQDDQVLAALGRADWITILLGAGQRIEVAGSEPWRLVSVGTGAGVGLVVINSSRQKLAMASYSDGGYDITGRDHGGVLVPGEPGRRRANRWLLSHGNDELAEVTRSPAAIDAHRAVPLAVVVLCLLLVRAGIPGEAPLRTPRFRW